MEFGHPGNLITRVSKNLTGPVVKIAVCEGINNQKTFSDLHWSTVSDCIKTHITQTFTVRCALPQLPNKVF